MTDLKLLAIDSEDLEVISTYTQDAVIKIDDMGYAKSDKRFILLMNRFAWEAEDAKGRGQRKRSGLHFDFVESAQFSGIDLTAKDGVLELLAITFTQSEEPSGEVTLNFAGGGTVRLKVECLEARLRDLGSAWAAKASPSHDID